MNPFRRNGVEVMPVEFLKRKYSMAEKQDNRKTYLLGSITLLFVVAAVLISVFFVVSAESKKIVDIILPLIFTSIAAFLTLSTTSLYKKQSDPVKEMEKLKNQIAVIEDDLKVAFGNDLVEYDVAENAMSEEEKNKEIACKNMLKQLNQAKVKINDTCDLFKNHSKLTLSMAIAIAISGLIPFFSVVLTSNLVNHSNIDATKALFERIPYFSLAVFIEFIAGIFLKMYYKQLEEMKYYRNESTNLTVQITVLQSAFYSLKEDALEKILGKLLDTERNRIIKKGETTEEIERSKANAQDVTALIKLINKVENIGK